VATRFEQKQYQLSLDAYSLLHNQLLQLLLRTSEKEHIFLYKTILKIVEGVQLHYPDITISGLEQELHDTEFPEILFLKKLFDKAHVSPVLMTNVIQTSVSKKGTLSFQPRELSQVIGITLPQNGETLLESHQRAEKLRQQILWYSDPSLIGKRRHFDLEPIVAVASPQQLKQWELQHDPVRPFESYRPGAPNVEIVLEYLNFFIRQLDLDSKIVFRVNTLSNREVEIMFLDKQGQPFAIDVLGLREMKKSKRYKEEWVGQVVGIKCFESEINETNRIEIVRSLSDHFRTEFKHADGLLHKEKILSVTQELITIWYNCAQTGKSPLKITEVESQSKSTAEYPQQYFDIYSQVKEIRYLTFERKPNGDKAKPAIGAKPSWIIVEYHDGHSEYICLDFGSQREDYYYNSLFQPAISKGLAPFRDILPSPAEMPKFYRLTLLLKTAQAAGKSFLENSEKNSDLIDLYLTLTLSDFTSLISQLDPELTHQDVTQFIHRLEDITKDSSAHKLKHIAFLISHFHDDHIGFAALVGSHIPQLFAAESSPWTEYFFNKSGWMKEITIRRQRDTLLTEEHARHYSPVTHPLQPFETRFVGRGNVSITSFPCDHSIYGSTMFLIVVYDDFGFPLKKVLYTGDYRFEDTGLTEKTVEALLAIGGVDEIITETTNIRPSKGSKKGSGLVTKEGLHQHYDDLFKQHTGKPVFVQVDPKDLHLIELICEHAKNNGRMVIHSMKHAEPIEIFRRHDAPTAFSENSIKSQQETVQRLAPTLTKDHWLNTTVFNVNDYHPRPDFDDSTYILGSGNQTIGRSEREIKAFYPEKMLKTEQLAHENDVVVFIRPTNPLEEELANIAPYLGTQGVVVVRAHYFTYQQRDRDLAWRDLNFCHKMGWEYVTDLIFEHERISASPTPKNRMSGHSKPEDFFNFMELLLQVNPQMRIIPVHGEKRRYVGDELQARFGQNVNVVKRMKNGAFELKLY